MIFMNVILRPNILYAYELYYNMKESELGQVEGWKKITQGKC